MLITSCRYRNVYGGLWRNKDHCDDYRYELAGQLEGTAHDGQMLQVRKAGSGEKSHVSWITPLVVCHERPSPTSVVVSITGWHSGGSLLATLD